jgi:hypothetical protein
MSLTPTPSTARAGWSPGVSSRCPAASARPRSVSPLPATERWRAGQRRPGGITRQGFTSTNAPGVPSAARTPGGPSPERSTRPTPGGADRRSVAFARRSARSRHGFSSTARGAAARLGRDRRASGRTGVAHALRLDTGRLPRYRAQADRHRGHAGERPGIRCATRASRLAALRGSRGAPTPCSRAPPIAANMTYEYAAIGETRCARRLLLPIWRAKRVTSRRSTSGLP